MPTTARTRPWPLPIAGAASAPGAYAGVADYAGLPMIELSPSVAALMFGGAIVGAAFLLSWAAEAAEVEVSAGVALAFLAFLAVLPEYGVDFVFTMRAGQTVAEQGHCAASGGEDPCTLALANMTGANRVLVGIGWPLVVLVAALVARRNPGQTRQEPSVPAPGHVRLTSAMSVEVVFLGIATLYSLTLPLRHTLTLIDAVVLLAVFGGYAWRLAQAPVEEPDLAGTSKWIADHERRARRWWLVGLFVVAAGVIVVTAEHFADAVVGTGEQLGIDRFLLVQWAAPVASEAPELIVACLYAWRLRASQSLGALLSSKVNQWTLLVGTIPIVFAVSSQSLSGLPLDTHQRYELLITAAQSLFAVSLLVNLRLSMRGATALIALFGVQFVTSIVLNESASQMVMVGLTVVYLAGAVIMFGRHYRRARRLVRDGTVADLTAMEEYDDEPAGAR
ncbi:sodium:proton exchanger [Mangrovihabitans endophyticus]|uniref:Sodium/hydrogen exchanger n=1 Tax=Mangrovihabitans endophyticus TaxID=1751298 RepID=A0A8J3C485_9ACTN|nr:sodium:proton exchanger [Mangrovihabitans endophyticus]GGL07315.1 sodium/hydrogen exchanger [Mangrovihabitans endophyticus]